MAEGPTREEHNYLVKTINGNLDRIDHSIELLAENVNRRFDSLDTKIEQERKVGREAHQRIHERVDGINESLTVECVEIGRLITKDKKDTDDNVEALKSDIDKKINKIKEGHISKNLALFIGFLSSLTLASIGIMATLIIKAVA